MLAATTDVFVSYKAEDRARVRPLVAALEAEGFSVWWDTHIGGGDHWREDIQEHLDAAKCVIVVWTKRSVGREGDFVRDEATRARKRGTYLPVRLDPVEPPLGFGEVQTISLKGWRGDRSDDRFRTLIEAVKRRIAGEDIPHRTVPRDSRALSRRVVLAGGAGIGALAVAGVGGWLLLKPAPANAKRIAVMDFDNLSGDPNQEYFAEGIAEELRSAMSRVGMQVIGRASCDAVKGLDIKAAASKLDVANILTGSFRRSPQTIRIEAQLVSGSDGVEHWRQSYDRPPDDAIKIQTDIAENVAEALSVVLGEPGRAALTIGGTDNVAAHELLLQAIRGIYTPRSKADVDRRIALLDGAISLDANYADAYVYKAFLLALKATADLGLAEALAVVNRAISIAPRLAHGYDVRGFIYWQLHQMRAALANAKHAVDLNGQDVNALGGYSNVLAAAGHFDQALKMSAKAIALDPLEPSRYRFRSDILFNARRYSEAADSARRAIELQPDFSWNRVSLVNALLAQGKYDDAQAELSKLDPTSSSRLAAEGLIAARTGQRSQALRKLKELKLQDGGNGHADNADIYAQLGMNDDAVKELYLATQGGNLSLVDFRADPFLDPLRRDPRLADLERKMSQ